MLGLRLKTHRSRRRQPCASCWLGFVTDCPFCCGTISLPLLALLARAAPSPVLTDAAPSTVLAPAALSPVLTEAAPSTVLH